MTFAWPLIFFALPLPVLAYLLLPKAKATGHGYLNIPFFSSLSNNTSENKITPQLNIIPIILFSLAWIALITAAARPQLLGEIISIPKSGRNLIMATDISGSMKERDMILNGRRSTRIAAVKQVAGEFLLERKGDKVGLIVFGSNAYVHAPLTFDLKTINNMLLDIEVGIAGQKTAIGDAIALSVKKVRDTKKSSKIDTENTLILLTDGTNTAGNFSPIEAAKLAAKEDIKIYPISFAPEPSFFNFGAEPDHKTMSEIAQITNGKYYSATNTEELKRIYKIIDKQEPIVSDNEFYRPVTELYYWPLLVSLLLLLIQISFKAINNKWRAKC